MSHTIDCEIINVKECCFKLHEIIIFKYVYHYNEKYDK